MDTGDLLRNEIYPAIFDSADIVFPELCFKRVGRDWHSPLKLDGTAPKEARTNKTQIKAKFFSRLYEQGQGSISFWDYIASREGLSQPKDILEKLAELARVSLPKLDPSTMDRIDKARKAAEIWAKIAEYSQWCLQNAKSKEADRAREYLNGRGYTLDNCEKMGLGFVPSRKQLFDCIDALNARPADVEAVKNQLSQGADGKPYSSSWGIGETHKIIIPYEASGRTIGLVARAQGEDKPKYLYPSGSGWRRAELFNLEAVNGDKDLVVMEGLLDALGASAIAGLPNVVALGDTGLNKDRIGEALRRGAKKITLCLDNDQGGQDGTARALRELALHAPEIPVYVAVLPEGKDPDDLLKEGGPSALKKAIAEALPGWEYQEKAIIRQYAERSATEGGLTRKDEDALIEELVALSKGVYSPVDRERLTRAAIEDLSAAGLTGLTESAFKEASDRIRLRETGAAQDRELAGLLQEAGRLQGEGKTKDALEILQERSRELQARGADYSRLLVTATEAEIRAEIKEQPTSLSSGYSIGGKELLFPSGALTIIAAPTSHGKTAALLNVFLNAAKACPGKKFYFFSYEESREAVTVRALNNYANMELSGNNRRTIKSHLQGKDEYFTGKAAPRAFIDKKEAFFKELIETGRASIHYSDYSAPELVEAIRYLKAHGEAGAVFVDYLQLLKKPGAGYSRQEELKEICLDLKDIAVESGLPLILAAQFNRTVTSPLKLFLQNIGEAGDIERAANLVLGIWNGNFKPEYETREKAELVKMGLNEDSLLKKGGLFAEILKNRDGEAGVDGWLTFNGNTGTIDNEEGSGRW